MNIEHQTEENKTEFTNKPYTARTLGNHFIKSITCHFKYLFS